MDLSDRITSMSDIELTNLSDNAARLGQSGTAGQKAQAATLLPLVVAEMTARRATKLKKIATAAPAAKAPARRRKAVKVEADAEADAE
jgi:hypothetical protein